MTVGGPRDLEDGCDVGRDEGTDIRTGTRDGPDIG